MMSQFKINFTSAICALFVLTSLVFTVSTEETAEVEEVFKKHGVVPDVIPNAPLEFLKVMYDGVAAEKGIELTPTQVKAPPTIEWLTEVGAYYTLIMTDPDAPSREKPTVREFKHWLLVNICSDNPTGEELAAYVGSGPPQGTGLHRYVFLMYKQPGKLEFDEKRVGNNSRDGRPKFKAADFAQKYNLGMPLAGNFYQAQWDEYVPTVHKQLSGQ